MKHNPILTFIVCLLVVAAGAVAYIYWFNANQNTNLNISIEPENKEDVEAIPGTVSANTNTEVSETKNAQSETDTVTTDNTDFNSCNVEATSFCNGLRDGKLALVDCLLNDHYDELSEACRNSLERRQVLNEELVAACSADRGKYCRGVEPQPGSEPMVDCLEEHYTQLSAACAAAFDAHDAAKPD